MNEVYNPFPRGTEWIRWDLHVHTPGTLKNDQFKGIDGKDKLTSFYDKIRSLPPKIKVIGITDYFSIKKYKEIKKYQEDNKGKEANLDNIVLFLPNIEFRAEIKANDGKKLNFHIIFSNEVSSDDIEKYFLHKLSYTFNYGNNLTETYNCDEEGFKNLGRNYLARHQDKNDVSDSEALETGMNQFHVNFDEVKKHLTDIKFEGKYLIGFPSGHDGLSGVLEKDKKIPNGFDHLRHSLASQADFIFSSHKGDRDYYSGMGRFSQEDVEKRYGKLIPCIHGSDAHSLEQVCEPHDTNNKPNFRYCWIKANPTFDGLKQILHEPAHRVFIGELPLEQKAQSNVIKRIKFIDNSGNGIFSDEWIYINGNLNAIIGGKSTGKSLLLYFIAKTIEYELVSKIQKGDSNYFQGQDAKTKKPKPWEDIENIDFEVEWGDGQISKLSNKGQNKQKSLTYLPQLYIHNLIKDEKEFKELILAVLKEDEPFRQKFDEFEKNKDNTLKNMESNISNLIDSIKKLDAHLVQHKKLVENENPDFELNTLENEKQDVINRQELSEDEKVQLQELEKQKKGVINGISNQSKLCTSFVNMRNLINAEEGILLQKITDEQMRNKSGLWEAEHIAKFEGEIENLKTKIANNWKELSMDLENKIMHEQKLLEEKNTTLNLLNDRISTIQNKVRESSDRLKKIEEKILYYNNKKKAIESSEVTKQILTGKIASLIELTNSYHKGLINLYDDLETFIGQKYSTIGESPNLILKTSRIFKNSEFKEKFIEKFKLNVKTANFEWIEGISADGYEYDSTKHVDFYQKFLDELCLNANRFTFKGAFDSYQAIRALAENYFDLQFDLQQDKDNLKDMSPGKRGTILLKLYLSLNKATNPILIDQPEDNLDNRTVFTELKDFIKEKKKSRQIILVTHNANLVVLTDAENTIVANQDGQGNKENEKHRFEYVTGGLEHSFSVGNNKKGILYTKGIKEHICEILEGGTDAFKKRGQKYSFSK